MACQCLSCEINLISRVMVSIGLTGQLYRNTNMSNFNYYGTDVKGILNQ